MKHRDSFAGTSVAHLAAVGLLGTLACRADAPEPAEATREEPADANGHEVHWSYHAEAAPDRWGALDPSFATCDSGVQQSPIDLANAIPAESGRLATDWRPTDAVVANNGHTIQVDVEPGSSIELEGRRFSLLQFHFHLPSEHTVEGESHPMEVHFVHQADEGDLAVIGVFMDVGEAHAGIEDVWGAIPDADEAPAPLAQVDPNAFLPEGRGYFRYAGSLTTPPCSEVVSWVVMTEPIAVSQPQIDAFSALFSMNARPVQPLHRRFVLANP